MDLVYLVKVVYTSDCSVLLTSWEVMWLVQYQLAKRKRAQSRGTTFVTTEGGSKIRNSQPQITKIASTWISLKLIVFQAYRHSVTLNITRPFQQNPETILQVAHDYFTEGSSSWMSFSGKLWIMEHSNKKCHYYSNKINQSAFLWKE